MVDTLIVEHTTRCSVGLSSGSTEQRQLRPNSLLWNAIAAVTMIGRAARSRGAWNHKMKKTLLATSAAILIAAANGASAQQGTTLAGPAQGSKANGDSSTVPSTESGANGRAMTRSSGAMTGRSDSVAPDASSQAPFENQTQKGSNPSANGK